jgi:hypothetical protein
MKTFQMSSNALTKTNLAGRILAVKCDTRSQSFNLEIPNK